jgi:hypothetical protein
LFWLGFGSSPLLLAAKRCHTYPETIEKEEKYGEIRLIDKQTVEIVSGINPLKINVSEINAIGEFTTADGPFVDDWFLTFITQTDYIEIPMYTNGMTEFLTDLGKVLNSDLSAKLTNSSEWNTRIVYPTEFRESEFYEIEFIEPKTFYEKFKKWIGMQDNVRVYSTELKKNN